MNFSTKQLATCGRRHTYSVNSVAIMGGVIRKLMFLPPPSGYTYSRDEVQLWISAKPALVGTTDMPTTTMSLSSSFSTRKIQRPLIAALFVEIPGFGYFAAIPLTTTEQMLLLCIPMATRKILVQHDIPLKSWQGSFVYVLFVNRQ